MIGPCDNVLDEMRLNYPALLAVCVALLAVCVALLATGKSYIHYITLFFSRIPPSLGYYMTPPRKLKEKA